MPKIISITGDNIMLSFFSKIRRESGFTLVEMIVAMGLFLVVIAITTGAFIHILRTQHETVAILAAEGNSSSAIEQIAREVRTGQGFSVVNGELQFMNAQNDSVVYRVNSATSAIERSADGGTTFEPITADNVLVKNLQFVLFTGTAGNPYPPRITIVLQAGAAGSPFTDPVVNLQTTVSARTLP
ncbi:prepilin-type N-terminal cleavage/methylation domain-containing protein [Patescibacteria group bacterium]|nr:prepilin-type N-terminal cleavage/methylation domain-containing protein [Patescibacteria group bacterium]